MEQDQLPMCASFLVQSETQLPGAVQVLGHLLLGSTSNANIPPLAHWAFDAGTSALVADAGLGVRTSEELVGPSWFSSAMCDRMQPLNIQFCSALRIRYCKTSISQKVFNNIELVNRRIVFFSILKTEDLKKHRPIS